MAVVTGEAPSSPCPLPTQFSQSRHFYVAVDRLRFKMETLLDLLGVAGRKALPIVLCCSSRDELDAVCSSISDFPYISLSFLYSDQAEAERAVVLEKFRQATVEWNQKITTSVSVSEVEIDDHKSCVVVVTDACLPFLASGESPILARVLINYEMPTKKETYLRRMSACLAADGIVINMVVGGEVVTLKSIEESSALLIAEMPIHAVLRMLRSQGEVAFIDVCLTDMRALSDTCPTRYLRFYDSSLRWETKAISQYLVNA